MGNARTVSQLSHETNPGRDARARAWAYVFDCYRKKEAAPESRPDDAKGSKNDRTRQKYTG